MPRRSKGPRLWLRPAHDGRPAAWRILDNGRQRATGLGIGASEAEKAEALKTYLTGKYTEHVTTHKRDPSQILVDDVLLKYVLDKVNKQARPEEVKQRVRFLRTFWGGKLLSTVTGDKCREYARLRSTPGAARRELEDLRAAINYHRKEGLHDRIVSVVLPDKSEPRERYLERSEAAALISAAWRYREKQNARATDRYTRRHIARFMVVARYMGARAGVICSASIEPQRPAGKPWINLKTGMFYGRGVGERETKKRRQMVLVPPPLLGHLRRWRKRGQRYVVQWNGKPVSRVTKAHNAVVKAAGLGTDVTPHIWRHSVATWLAQGGADPLKAADFLAMSLATFMAVYRHHHPEDSAVVHATFHAHRRQRYGNDISEQKEILTHRNAQQRTVSD
jgi:integrase